MGTKGKKTSRFYPCPCYKSPKKKYDSRTVAEFDLKMILANASLTENPVDLGVFKCKRCRYWHVGSLTEVEKTDGKL